MIKQALFSMVNISQRSLLADVEPRFSESLYRRFWRLEYSRRYNRNLAAFLYKAEVIHRPWGSFEADEFATLEWVDWFNHRRLLEPI